MEGNSNSHARRVEPELELRKQFYLESQDVAGENAQRLIIQFAIHSRGVEPTTHWYDLHSLVEADGEPCVLAEHNKQNYLSMSATCGVGMFIFVVGGAVTAGTFDFYNPRCGRDDVYILDTRVPQDGFKKGPNLLSDREEALAFPLGNNTLCVIGGSQKGFPFAEVFDLDSWTWRDFGTLNNKSALYPTDTLVAYGITCHHGDDYDDIDCNCSRGWYRDNINSAEGGCVSMKQEHLPSCLKKLYVQDRYTLFCYSFSSSTWEVVQKITAPDGNGARVGGVFCYFNKYSINYDTDSDFDSDSECESESMGNRRWLEAYSFIKRRWCTGRISGFDEYPHAMPYNDSYPNLFQPAKDGSLWLLWADDVVKKLYCTNFVVSVKESNGELLATAQVKCFKSCDLPPDGDLIDSVVV